MMESEKTVREYATYTTDDIGLATVLLCQPGFFIAQVIPQPPKTPGVTRPWCRVEVGGPDMGLLCEITEEHNTNPDGVLVPSRKYEEKRRIVMGAVQNAQKTVEETK